MEDIEVPTEHLHESIKEKLEEKMEGHGNKESWSMYLAISTALMAVFAAIGSLFAGHHSNEALIAQIKSSDTWAHYQAKSIKYQIATVLKEVKAGKGESGQVDDKLEGYKKDQEELKIEAEKTEKESAYHLAKHVTLARSVTIFQISIAVSAIAMLTQRKFLWYGSMVFSIVGVVLFIMGMI
jgi:midasin (ATPase involved in ribosome maturation)